MQCPRCETNSAILRKIIFSGTIQNKKLTCLKCRFTQFLGKEFEAHPEDSKKLVVPDGVLHYPFHCKRCGKQVNRPNFSRKYHKKQLCRKRCDGLLRDSGGYPKDRNLKTIIGNSKRKNWVEYCLERNKTETKSPKTQTQSGSDKFKTQSEQRIKAYGKSFYSSREWLELRYKAFVKYGRSCKCCGASNCELHVDHVKPRSKHPELELDIDNLQILCGACNRGKGSWDETDWR